MSCQCRSLTPNARRKMLAETKTSRARNRRRSASRRANCSESQRAARCHRDVNRLSTSVPFAASRILFGSARSVVTVGTKSAPLRLPLREHGQTDRMGLAYKRSIGRCYVAKIFVTFSRPLASYEVRPSHRPVAMVSEGSQPCVLAGSGCGPFALAARNNLLPLRYIMPVIPRGGFADDTHFKERDYSTSVGARNARLT